MNKKIIRRIGKHSLDPDQDISQFAPKLRREGGNVLARLPGDPDFIRHESGPKDIFERIGLAFRDVAPGLAHSG